MKKLLIATAALAMVAGTVQAQSSVTIYGIVDMSWQSQDNGGTAATSSGMVTDTLASSRLGFRGTEDLGGGLKANFVLEGSLNAATGTTGTTVADDVAAPTFNRAAWVSLSSANFGELRVGRQDVTGANDIDSFVSQMGNLGNFTAAVSGASTAGLGADKNNAIVYVSPTFNGLQFQVGHASAATVATGVITEATDGSTDSYLVSYIQGPVKLYAAKQEQRGATAAVDNIEETIFGGSYDAGFASFGVAMQQSETGTSAKGKQASYSVAAPVKALGSGVKVHLGYKTAEDSNTANKGTETTTLAVTKALSKRTSVYAVHSSVDHESAHATPANRNKSIDTTIVGVLHTF
jgi:predicted porin